MRRFVGVALLALSLAACARHARLYPVNETAKAAGAVLEATFIASGTGSGRAEIVIPSGETLKGEFTVVRNGAMGFGSVTGTAYSGMTSASYSGFSQAYAVEGASNGVATLYGEKGTTAECRFNNDNFSGHGYGECLISTGALYRLQY